MDGPAIECSDSDSGESWTLLENSIHTDDTQELTELQGESTPTEIHEKDEDTDGISIISDSEPDSPSPCQLNYEITNDDNCPSDHKTAQFISVESQLNNVENDHEDIKEHDDFLGNKKRKNKTYVHRRNKRLSSVLNIVVLASVITALGVAIGHTWGTKSDCTLNNTPGVNKILSRLYRLQEENAYLRSKLKEITALNSYQANKAHTKHNKCRKMFEEPLQNDENKKLVTTCVDGKVDIDDRLLKSHMIQPPYEKDFVQDVRKLRNVYVQNRSWINEKAIKKIINEKDQLRNKQTALNFRNEPKQKYEFNNNKMTEQQLIDEAEKLDNKYSKKVIDKNRKITKTNVDIQSNAGIEINNNKYKKNNHESIHTYINYNINQNSKTAFNENNKKFNERDDNEAFESKVNNQKLDKGINLAIGTDKIETDDFTSQNAKDDNASDQKKYEINPEDRMFPKKDLTKVYAREEDVNKNSKDNINIDTDSSFEGLKKDNRYTAPKHKLGRKKHDRQKSHKKEKKRNKYEQWEMKGGLMKDYDDISLTSSSWTDDNSHSGKEQNFRGDIGENFNCDSGSVTDKSNEVLANDEYDSKSTETCENNRENDVKLENAINWVDKRANNRMEARRRLEKELFEDNITTAGWYFKRMRKREQCRAKGDNSTYRKLSKRFKNHKTKQ